jgi:hypothetical protein
MPGMGVFSIGVNPVFGRGKYHNPGDQVKSIHAISAKANLFFILSNNTGKTHNTIFMWRHLTTGLGRMRRVP